MEENDASKNVVTDYFESACSSPLVSAPSSPDGGGGGGGGFFYSAPASPIHFLLSSSSSSSNHVERNGGGFEFEFTVKEEAAIGAVPADELFLNGQIRPMKLSSHLQLPQILDVDDNDEIDDDCRVRDIEFRSRSKSLRRRRARSMSPTPSLRATPFQWLEDFQSQIKLEQEEEEEKQQDEEEDKVKDKDKETTPSGASSRSSSVGRTSKRWVQLKDFLYRSKSEGTNTGNYKFWTALSKKSSSSETTAPAAAAPPEIGVSKKKKEKKEATTATNVRKAVNGVGKRMGRSPHELHYTTNRAQAEELRRKTYLPYKQGLLGCLGFSSKSYGAMNGFARALNPVSSR